MSGWNLVDQLDAHHLSWKGYMEDLPYPCYQGAQSGGYVKRHEPFLYFDDIRNDQQRCRNLVPFKDLSHDLSQNSLPRFAFIAPNLCHDMHDCSTSTGDAFLKRRLPPILETVARDEQRARHVISLERSSDIHHVHFVVLDEQNIQRSVRHAVILQVSVPSAIGI